MTYTCVYNDHWSVKTCWDCFEKGSDSIYFTNETFVTPPLPKYEFVFSYILKDLKTEIWYVCFSYKMVHNDMQKCTIV